MNLTDGFTLLTRLRSGPWHTVAWRVLTAASLGIVGVGTLYAWRELPTASITVAPEFLVAATATYIATYILHILGWHMLAMQFLGQAGFRYNLEAAASSSLVKYLPTVAWYIANRTDYYAQWRVPRNRVVVASFVELGIMIGSGSALLASIWLATQFSDPSVVVAIGSATVGIAALMVVVGKVISKTAIGSEGDRQAVSGSVLAKRWPWFAAAGFYTLTWLLGACFLVLLLHAFVPVDSSGWLRIAQIWLLAGIGSYVVGITLGSLGIVRELTLGVMLAQFLPLNGVLVSAVLVKTILTVGEILCSAVAILLIRLTGGGFRNE